MSKKIENIDLLFKSGLDDIQISPPDGVFETIQNELQQRSFKKVIFYFKAFAASVALIVSIGIGYYFGTLSVQKNIVAQKTQTTNYMNNRKNKSPNVVVNQNIKRSILVSYSENNVQIKDTNDYTILKPHKDTSINAEIEKKLIINIDTISEFKALISIKTLKLETKLNDIEPDKPIFDNLVKNNEKFLSGIWQIGITASPIYAYRAINEFSGFAPSIINKIEKPILAISGGIFVKHTFPRWEFETGLFYSQNGQKIDNAWMVNTKTMSDGKQVASSNSVIVPVEGLNSTKNGISKSDWNSTANMNFNYTIGNFSNFQLQQVLTSYFNQEKTSNYNEIVVYINNPKNIDRSVTDQLTNNFKDSLQIVSNTFPNYDKNIESISSERKVIVTSPGSTDTVLVNMAPANIRQTNTLIEIPIIARYQIYQKRIGIKLSAGVSSALLLQNMNKVKSSLNNMSYYNTNKLYRLNFIGIAGLTFDYKLNSKITFNLQPLFRYNINSIYKNKNIKVHPYTYGLFTGLSFAL